MFDITVASDVFDFGQALFADWVQKARESAHICSETNSYSVPSEELVDRIGKILTNVVGKCSVVRISSHQLVAESKEAFLTVYEAASSHDAWKISVFGSKEVVAKLVAALDKGLTPFHSASINWWYLSSNGPTSTTLILDTPRPFEPLMYPIKKFGGDPLQYMRDYYESSASILFLLGPPGTGKTSLIRQFLWEEELNALVTYDEKVLRNDAMFIEFMGGGHAVPGRRRSRSSNTGSDVMVLEDVTELLAKREMDKNEMMARFLNVSDGLIQLPNKKIIFTTNLPSLKDVDPALLRPGRCHDVVEMRPLFYEEAVAACRAAGLPIPIEKRDYFMSELYNQGSIIPAVPRLGIR
jgi:hypothetical protein